MTSVSDYAGEHSSPLQIDRYHIRKNKTPLKPHITVSGTMIYRDSTLIHAKMQLIGSLTGAAAFIGRTQRRCACILDILPRTRRQLSEMSQRTKAFLVNVFTYTI